MESFPEMTNKVTTWVRATGIEDPTPQPGLRPAAVALRAVSSHAGGWFRSLGWVSSDEFSLRYSDLVTGSYDCVDRIVLNAFFPLGHNPGGLRTWWRRWHGDSDAELDNTHLMRMAGSRGGSRRGARPTRCR
jgi:hypothetical protein